MQNERFAHDATAPNDISLMRRKLYNRQTVYEGVGGTVKQRHTWRWQPATDMRSLVNQAATDHGASTGAQQQMSMPLMTNISFVPATQP